MVPAHNSHRTMSNKDIQVFYSVDGREDVFSPKCKFCLAQFGNTPLQKAAPAPTVRYVSRATSLYLTHIKHLDMTCVSNRDRPRRTRSTSVDVGGIRSAGHGLEVSGDQTSGLFEVDASHRTASLVYSY